MASYKLSETAEADLIRIHQWGVRNHGESQADTYFADFFDHFELLAKQPLIFPIVDNIVAGYRRSVCGVDNVYYRLDGDIVEIMAILGSQEARNWL